MRVSMRLQIRLPNCRSFFYEESVSNNGCHLILYIQFSSASSQVRTGSLPESMDGTPAPTAAMKVKLIQQARKLSKSPQYCTMQYCLDHRLESPEYCSTVPMTMKVAEYCQDQYSRQKAQKHLPSAALKEFNCVKSLPTKVDSSKIRFNAF